MHLTRALALLALTLPLLGLAPAAQALQPGKDYVELAPARPTESQGKIEVIEFFGYTCPHCDDIEGDLVAWSKTLPKDVVLRRVPAVFNERWAPFARIYYALEATGQLPRLHGEVFDAIHREGVNLGDPETFFNWAAQKGADRAKVAEAYNSFAINTKLLRARQLGQDYKLTGVPSFAVNGKYVTSASMTGSHQAVFAALNTLIRQEREAAKRK